MKIFSYLAASLLFIIFFGCENSDEDTQIKASDKVKEITGMSSDESNNAASNFNMVKKYPVKSGIIKFERKMLGESSKVIVYFDDYGTKERNEAYNPEGNIEEIRFTDGEKMYVINYKYSDESVAYIMGSGTMGTEMKFVPEPFVKDSDIEKYSYKKLPNIQIAGKDCEAYSTTSKMGTVIFAGSNNLLLYTKADVSVGESETKALEIQENANVDPSLFKVPAGYEVKNM